MLEHAGLLVAPWMPEEREPRGTRRREICLPATGQPLGFADTHWRSPHWLSWLFPQTLQVFETEDASLLMTVYRPWGPVRTWSVLDAEERRVGIIYRGYLLDGRGSHLARAHWTTPNCGRFLDPRGTELGAFEFRKHGTLLTFTDVLEGQPFARMALLGTVLTWG